MLLENINFRKPSLTTHRKLTPFQKKILDCIEKGEMLAKFVESKTPFDFYCINDFCGARNGKRYDAIAWKNSDGSFGVFCGGCGEDHKLSKEDFKDHQKKISREMALINMEKTKEEKNGP